MTIFRYIFAPNKTIVKLKDDVVFIWRIIHVNSLMRLTMKFPPLQPEAELPRNQRGEIGRQHIRKPQNIH